MKNFLLVAVTLAAALFAFDTPEVQAAGRGSVFVSAGGANVAVVNQRRGLFGRVRNTQVVSANAFGNVNVTNVQNRGLFGRRTRVQSVNVNNGFGGANVAVVNSGFRRNNVVAINNGFVQPTFVSRGFVGNNFAVVNTNPYAAQAVLVRPSVAFNARVFNPAVASFQSVGFQQPVVVQNACVGGFCNTGFVGSFGGCR
jgi:hypothetical protein